METMGSILSGNRYQHGKPKTSSTLRLDIKSLRTAGALKPNTSSDITWSNSGRVIGSIRVLTAENSVTLQFTATKHGIAHEKNQYVQLEQTPCNYGGYRQWFACPSCGKRVSVLFSGVEFKCRQCHKLSYQSQSECRLGRSNSKLSKLRKRLSWYDDNLPTIKPRYMHQTTFYRLRSQALDAYVLSMTLLNRRFEKLIKAM